MSNGRAQLQTAHRQRVQSNKNKIAITHPTRGFLVLPPAPSLTVLYGTGGGTVAIALYDYYAHTENGLGARCSEMVGHYCIIKLNIARTAKPSPMFSHPGPRARAGCRQRG